MIMDLTNATKTLRIKPDGSGYTVVAGTTDVNSDVVDTSGFDGIRFIVGFGTITSGAATSIKVQDGADSALADSADLAGTSITVLDTDDNKVAISEILKPQKRYARVVTKRATQNAVIDFVLVELFHARSEPVTKDTSVLGQETWVAPADGTA